MANHGLVKFGWNRMQGVGGGALEKITSKILQSACEVNRMTPNWSNRCSFSYGLRYVTVPKIPKVTLSFVSLYGYPFSRHSVFSNSPLIPMSGFHNLFHKASEFFSELGHLPWKVIRLYFPLLQCPHKVLLESDKTVGTVFYFFSTYGVWKNSRVWKNSKVQYFFLIFGRLQKVITLIANKFPYLHHEVWLTNNCGTNGALKMITSESLSRAPNDRKIVSNDAAWNMPYMYRSRKCLQLLRESKL